MVRSCGTRDEELRRTSYHGYKQLQTRYYGYDIYQATDDGQTSNEIERPLDVGTPMVMDRMGTSEYLVANTRYACTPRSCHPKNDDSGWSQPRINGYLGDKRVQMSWCNWHPYLCEYSDRYQQRWMVSAPCAADRPNCSVLGYHQT